MGGLVSNAAARGGGERDGRGSLFLSYGKATRGRAVGGRRETKGGAQARSGLSQAAARGSSGRAGSWGWGGGGGLARLGPSRLGCLGFSVGRPQARAVAMSQAKRSRLWKAQRAEEGAAEATTSECQSPQQLRLLVGPPSPHVHQLLHVQPGPLLKAGVSTSGLAGDARQAKAPGGDSSVSHTPTRPPGSLLRSNASDCCPQIRVPEPGLTSPKEGRREEGRAWPCAQVSLQMGPYSSSKPALAVIAR